MNVKLSYFDHNKKEWIICTVSGRHLGDKIKIKSINSDDEYIVMIDSYLLKFNIDGIINNIIQEHEIREKLKKIDYWWLNHYKKQ